MSLKFSLIFLFICKCSRVHCQTDCDSIRNCKQCIQAPSCGWYLQYRSSKVSGCFRNANITTTEEGYTYPPKSSFHVVKNENGSVISPQQVALNLRLNEPFTFPVTFTPRGKERGKTRTVELVHNINRKGAVEISFFTNCSGQFPELVRTTKCENVEFGQSVEFLVEVQQVRCSKHQPQRIKKFQINSSNGVHFLLNVYAYCHCPCEYEETVHGEVDCHKRGKFTCGVCYCREGYAGENCQINTSNSINE